MISNRPIDAIGGVYLNNLSPKIKTNQMQSIKEDKLVLSNQCKSFASHLNKIREMQEVDMDKVKFYQQKIQNNEYKVDANKLASKILESIVY